MSLKMISGLYPYVRDGVYHEPLKTKSEIEASLKVNPEYRELLTVFAGDEDSARFMEEQGLVVARIFTDAPDFVRKDMAHMMKHWICTWAAREYGEFLWVDWDTIMLKQPDDAFRKWCRCFETPKFLRIPGYWARVNCGVYYSNSKWCDAMLSSFHSKVDSPNDELLWASLLPENIEERPEFWLGERAVNVWKKENFSLVHSGTYFAHVRHLEWADEIRDFFRDELRS